MSSLTLDKNKIRIVLFEGIHPHALEIFAEHGYTNVERLTRAATGPELIEKVGKAHMIGIRSRT